MPFKKDKYGNLHYDPNGKYRLPPGPKAWVDEKKKRDTEKKPQTQKENKVK